MPDLRDKPSPPPPAGVWIKGHGYVEPWSPLEVAQLVATLRQPAYRGMLAAAFCDLIGVDDIIAAAVEITLERLDHGR